MDSSTSSPIDSRPSGFRENTQYEILTPSGFQSFDGIRQKTSTVHRVSLSDGTAAVMTPEHLVLAAGKLWVAVKDILPGTRLLTKEERVISVVAVSRLYVEQVFDPVNVANGALYDSGVLISHNCSFLSTSYTLIRAEVLQALVPTTPLSQDETGYCEFVAPVEGHTYVMLIDTAAGQGLDASAFAVIDVSELPYQVAATYNNNRISTMDYPQVIMKYSRHYFTPWLMAEVMDIGRDVAHILFRDYEYPRFMATMTEKRLGQRLIFNSRNNRHLGLRMTAGVKRSGASVLKALVENGQLVIHDYRIIQQLSVFIQRGSIYMAEPGHHDDLVVPLLMLGWASLQPNFAEVTVCRALDSYIDMVQQSKDNPVPIKEVYVEKPMPIGIFTNLGDNDDSAWLLD